MPPEESEYTNSPLFAAGVLRATAKAARTIPAGEVLGAMARHLNGDWGDVDADDWRANDRAVTDGSRIFSVYHTDEGRKFWVITEADRSYTTILLPEDY
jgi:hypothetical protein